LRLCLARNGEAVFRVLVDQRLDRIVDIHAFSFTDENRVRAIGYGRNLSAEDVDLRLGEIEDALRRTVPGAEAEARFRRCGATEGG